MYNSIKSYHFKWWTSVHVTYETQSELSRSRCSTCHMKCDIARMSTLTRKTVSTCKPILTPPPTPYRGGQVAGSPNLAPNSILMFLVDLDVHQIAGYHFFDHHLPSWGAPTTPPTTIIGTPDCYMQTHFDTTAATMNYYTNDTNTSTTLASLLQANRFR